MEDLNKKGGRVLKKDGFGKLKVIMFVLFSFMCYKKTVVLGFYGVVVILVWLFVVLFACRPGVLLVFLVRGRCCLMKDGQLKGKTS